MDSNPDLMKIIEGKEGLPENASESVPPEQNLKDIVIEVMRTVYDPEIPVNVYELGLVYGIDVDPAGVYRDPVVACITREETCFPGKISHKQKAKASAPDSTNFTEPV
jgi:metal-sulfur cluster biosynthetic enzyme